MTTPTTSTDSLHQPEGIGPTSTSSPPSARSRSRLAWTAAVVTLLLVAGAAFFALQDRDPEIFPEGDAWHEPIVDNPRLDPTSEAVAELLAAPDGKPTLNLNRYGNPIYTADEDTPRYDLEIVNAGTDKWGDNVLAHQSVPIPDDVEPSSGTDAKMVIIDPSTNQVFDIWQAERVNGQWQASWGGIYPLDGDGSSRRASYGDGKYQVEWAQPVSRGTGSGISSLAGVIRTSELEDGVIPHALAFSTNRACGPAQSGPHRWPATTTDGWVTGEPCIPQGARIQLDPSIDLEQVPGLTAVERMIGKALQEYGAYCIDIGGARMAFATEAARTPEDRAIFEGLELADDYHMLEKLPQDFTMLASWDGS